MTQVITLQHTEMILAVVPDRSEVPVLSDMPLWVHIVDSSNNKRRVECIHPDDQTPEMRALFHTLRMAHNQMLALVKTRRLKA